MSGTLSKKALSGKKRARKVFRKLPHLSPGFVVLLASLIYFVTLSALSIERHEVYSSSRFDLGNMDQAVWNSSEGRILEATDEEGNLTSRLKNHADFLLLAFVPLYWIHPSPIWLLVAQAAVVGLGAVPLFWLARRFLGDLPGGEWPAALISLAYLTNFGLQSANLFDFHAQTMAPTLLLFAFHYLLEKRLWPFLIFGVLASMAKEEIVLIVAMMGLYAAVVERRWRWGIPVFVAGTAYFLLIMQVVIPLFNQGDSSELISERYGVIGGSISGLVRASLADPFTILGYALSEAKLLYLAYLVGLGGGLGIFAPAALALPLPEVAVNLLSERPQMTRIHYHYSAPILPFMYLASAAGIRNLIRFGFKLRRRRVGVWVSNRFSKEAALRVVPLFFAADVLIFNVYMNHLSGPLPWARDAEANPVVMRQLPDSYIENLDEVVALIPDGARVSAGNWIGPHLAHRRYLYLFPVIRDAEYVIVDRYRASYYTGVNRPLMRETLRDLRQSGEFRQIYQSANVVVFERID